MKSFEEYIRNKGNYIINDAHYMFSFEDFCDVNNITEDKITDKTHQIHIDTIFHKYNPLVMDKFVFSGSQFIIHEMLMSSLTSGKFIQLLKDKFKVINVDPDVNLNVRTQFYVIFDDIHNVINDETFFQVLNFANYFVVSLEDTGKILFHPYIPDECTKLIYTKYKGIIYHITLQQKKQANKILKYGLQPKGRGDHQIHCKDKELEQELNDEIQSIYRPKHIYFVTREDKTSEFKIKIVQLSQMLQYTKLEYRFNR